MIGSLTFFKHLERISEPSRLCNLVRCRNSSLSGCDTGFRGTEWRQRRMWL